MKLIYGAPSSGKTTYMKERLKDNDIVYDFDDLMQSLTGLPYQQMNSNVIDYVIDIRHLILDKLVDEKNIDTAYIITTFLSDSLEARLKKLNTTYIKMNTDPYTCLHRVGHSDRIDKDRVKGIVYEWYNKYTKPNGKYKSKKEQKRFYNSSAWCGKNGVRQQRLKIDNHECQQCKREGSVHADSIKVTGQRKSIQLNVHHKLELEKFPELALDINHLESVCLRHHNRMHDRFKKFKNKWEDDEKW